MCRRGGVGRGSRHARYADLCILGQDQPEGISSVGYTFAEQMLFVTGRPVLFVPPVGSFKTLGRHIVVAWNSSRPAARAINDAVPLIERADRTTVLMNNPSGFIDPHHALPEELIVEHLRRHGVSADAAGSVIFRHSRSPTRCNPKRTRSAPI